MQASHVPARKRRYADSIESLVRNNIQKMKIDMANEVIDAGRFDMQTSMEERKQTLEALLQVLTVMCTHLDSAQSLLTPSCCVTLTGVPCRYQHVSNDMLQYNCMLWHLRSSW